MADRSEARGGGQLVTIVIPCFNYARYLETCIGSVLAQSYQHWEAIVVDDASTEGDVTAEVGRFPDSRIRLVRHKENGGLAVARNTGIREGAGELVLPLDSDDKLDPTYLARLVAWLGDNPDEDAVFPDFEMFDGRTGRIRFDLRSTEKLLVEQ